MPPKLKRTKGYGSKEGSTSGTMHPRVILRPFMRDHPDQHRSHLRADPPMTSLFNKPEFSDIKLRVGQECYFAHKVVLCAASEVFARMLSSDWVDTTSSELDLHEEGDCAKVFDRLLYYCYSGSITISETFVIPLFILADKYDVKPVYDECVKIIEKGLKVYVVDSAPSEAAGCAMGIVTAKQEGEIKYAQSSASGSSTSEDSSSGSDAFDSDDSAIPSTSYAATSQAPLSPNKSPRTLRLIGSETFSVSTVIKMLNMWQNPRISAAALYNLEARLGNQISQENYWTWNSLQQDLVVRMLGDTHFCYGEYGLFKAAKSWVTHSADRQCPEIIHSVISQIRFPLLQPQELYEVEKDEVVRQAAQVLTLIQEAMRYQLFQNCCDGEDRLKWTCIQFQARKPRLL